MAVIVNRESIKEKALAHIRSPQYRKDMQDEIMRRRKDGRGGEDIGLEIHTVSEMDDMLQELITLLRSHSGVLSGALPSSVAAHFYALYATRISFSHDGQSASASVVFGGDLGRDSIVGYNGYYGGGIDDIVSLFDTGYTAGGVVYGKPGKWNDELTGGVTHSLQEREGLGFLKSSIDAFNAAHVGFAFASLD